MERLDVVWSRFSRVFLVVLLSLLALVSGAVAEEVWGAKSYTEWTEEECLEVLTDSPWAKRVRLIGPLTWNYDPRSEVGPGDLTGLRQNEPPSSLRGGRNQSPRRWPTFLVQWASATTFRQAVAHVQELRGNITREQAAQWLAQPSLGYELMVSGSALGAFAGLDEQWYQNNCRLRLKPSEVSLAPEAVHFIRAPDTEQVTNVTLLFPRRDDADRETISADVEKAELSCKRARSELSATFDVREMVAEGKPDR